MKYRIDEMRLRYRNFADMGMLYPTGWIYVLRPVVAGCIPSRMILVAKKVYHLIHDRGKKKIGEEITAIPENITKGLENVPGLGKII